jgi:GH43 family beta-xylosidase
MNRKGKSALALALGALMTTALAGCGSNEVKMFDAGVQLSEGTYAGNLFTGNPVKGIELGADPTILYEDGWYYCYPTTSFPIDGGGYGVYRSKDLWNWEDLGACYTTSGDSWAHTQFWAPEVTKIGGKFYLFSTGGRVDGHWTDSFGETHHRHAVGVAVADNPWGPFEDLRTEEGERFVFAPDYSVIDADVFVDDDGKIYFYYTREWNDNPVTDSLIGETRESHIYGAEIELSEHGFEFRSEPKLLVRPSLNWHHFVTEAPHMHKSNGVYYLTYSSGSNKEYSVGCKIGTSPLGDFTDAEESRILYSDSDSQFLSCSGHHAFVTSPEGDSYIIYHTCVDATEFTWDRNIRVDRVFYNADGIVCAGPTAEYVWYPRERIGYYNIAPEGTVVATNGVNDASLLNDNRIVVNWDNMKYEWKCGKTSATVNVKFDQERAVKAVMIYSSVDRFANIIESAKVTIAGVTQKVKFIQFSTGVAIAELEKAVSVSEVKIEVSATDGELALSEIVVLGL